MLTRRVTRRGWRGVALAAALVLVATGCNFQTTGTPANATVLNAYFDDVRNLVVGHGVRINDVEVGVVTRIDLLDDYRVAVQLAVEPDRPLPDGTAAWIRRTSLLGEDYVELRPPDDASDDGPLLQSGAELTDTRTLPGLEDVAHQAEILIAAFVVDDLQAIIDAAVEAFGGRGLQLNTMVTRIADLSTIYANDSERVGRIIDNLAQLGGDLTGATGDFEGFLQELSATSDVLTGQRDRIVQALEDLVHLADTAQATVFSDRTITSLERTLRELSTIASGLTINSDKLLEALHAFTHLAVMIPQVVERDALVLWGILVPTLPGGTTLLTSNEPLDADGLQRLLGGWQ